MKDKQTCLHNTETVAKEHIMANLKLAQMEQAISTLKKKSPEKDGIINEMLNCNWKRGKAPQAWTEAILIPVQKKGKDLVEPNAITLSVYLGVWENQQSAL